MRSSIAAIREKVGSGKVLLALSGGVDSSVAAALIAEAVGDQLTCVFVDHGLMRKNEGDEVEAAFRKWDLHFVRVDAEARFLGKLAGVTEPGLRVTFDTGIRWRTDHLSLTAGDGGAPLLGDGRILMELKTPDACPLWLSRALSQAGARATSFSKYGTCYREHLEAGAQNHFKEALHSA